MTQLLALLITLILYVGASVVLVNKLIWTRGMKSWEYKMMIFLMVTCGMAMVSCFFLIIKIIIHAAEQG